jgi:hypothetical protein
MLERLFTSNPERLSAPASILMIVGASAVSWSLVAVAIYGCVVVLGD